MPGPADLQALAVALLELDIEALDTIPILAPGLEGAPERAFVSPGRPALDCCDQLAVHAQTGTAGDTAPGGLAAGRRLEGMLNHVRLITTITRCVQDSRRGATLDEAPLPADLEATAAQTNADVWALWNHIYNAWRSGHFRSLCDEVFFDGAIALPQEGGCAGWVLTMRFSFGGYEETIAS